MKKITSTLIFVLLCGFGYGQGNGHHGNSNDEHWDIFGNSIDAADVFGTINNFPINFITNNTQKMSLGTNGVLTINNLVGTGTRLLRTDANGNITALPAGSVGQFLLSDGTWANLPSSATLFGSSGNDFFSTNSGNFGIGTTSPQFKLDVVGDARIANNLYVGGGVVITNQVDATLQVQTGDMIVNNDLSVAGRSTFNGTLSATKGITFDNAQNIGMFYEAPSTSYPGGAMIYGRGGGPTPPAVPTCLTPNNNIYFQHFGWIQPRANAGLVNSALTIGSAPWDGNGIIEVEGTDATGGASNALMINYFCGRNTLINTNNGLPNRGGTVFMGEKVEMAQSLKIGYSGTNPLDLNNAIEVYPNVGTGCGVRVNTFYGGVKALTVGNNLAPEAFFTVYGSGNTHMGRNVQIGFANSTIQDASTSLNLYTPDASVTTGINLSNGPSANWTGIKFTTPWNGAKLISASNSNLPLSPILVFADGRMEINTYSSSQAFAITGYDGTNAPKHFIINGDGSTNITTSLSNQKMFAIDNTAYSASAFEVLSNGLTTLRVNPSLSTYALVINDITANKTTFKVQPGGKTQIGFDTQDNTGPHLDAMLTVGGTSGKIVAKSIYVRIQNWSDYVFEQDYKLPDLFEIEAYYKKYKHLSDVPSEKEVLENGVSLGDMNNILLKKIEELTILMVRQEKQIQENKNEIELLKNTLKVTK